MPRAKRSPSTLITVKTKTEKTRGWQNANLVFFINLLSDDYVNKLSGNADLLDHGLSFEEGLSLVKGLGGGDKIILGNVCGNRDGSSELSANLNCNLNGSIHGLALIVLRPGSKGEEAAVSKLLVHLLAKVGSEGAEQSDKGLKLVKGKGALVVDLVDKCPH